MNPFLYEDIPFRRWCIYERKTKKDCNPAAALLEMTETEEKPPCRCGRAWRHRRKRRRAREEGNIPVVVDADSVFLRLNQWLKKGKRNFSQVQLKAAVFADTGRGLMATRAVQPGEVLVSIPKEVLITSSKVVEDAVLWKALQESHMKFRAMDLLALFLLYQKYLGEKSWWKVYLDSLPTEYSVPAYCRQEELDAFPEILKTYKLKQNEDVSQCYYSIQVVISTSAYLQSLFSSLCIEEVRWSWFTVNTRAVYLKNENSSPIVIGDDTCALAPYLDLLNHTHTAQMKAYLNPVNSCYEIETQVRYEQYDQVFINYGPHDNLKLYVEYGFILPQNPHNHVPVTMSEVVQVAKLALGEEDSNNMNNKIQLVSSLDLDKNLGVSIEGPSWSLEAAVTICLMPSHQLFQGWQLVCEDLAGVGHREKVVSCLWCLMQHKLQHLEDCMQSMIKLTQKTSAATVAEALLEQWCITLKSAMSMHSAGITAVVGS